MLELGGVRRNRLGQLRKRGGGGQLASSERGIQGSEKRTAKGGKRLHPHRNREEGGPTCRHSLKEEKRELEENRRGGAVGKGEVLLCFDSKKEIVPFPTGKVRLK